MSPPADPLLDRMPVIGGTLTEGAQIGTTLDPRPERINDVRSWSAITTADQGPCGHPSAGSPSRQPHRWALKESEERRKAQLDRVERARPRGAIP